MPDRKIRISHTLTPTHDSVRVQVVLEYLKGAPIETVALTPEAAADLGWRLVKAAEDSRRNARASARQENR